MKKIHENYRVRIIGLIVFILFFLFGIFLYSVPADAYVRNESINRKIDVYSNYIRTGQTLSDLVSFLNANLDNKYELLLAQQTFELPSSISIPTNAITISFERGAKIQLGSYDLTFNGQNINAQPSQNILNENSTGKTLGKIANRIIYPEWWGCSTGLTDNSSYFYDCVTFANIDFGKIIQFGEGTYNFNTDLTFLAADSHDNYTIRGIGRTSTRITNTNSSSTAMWTWESGSRITLEDMYLTGEAKGVWFKGSNYTWINRCSFLGFDGSAIVLQGNYGGGQTSDHTRISYCSTRFSGNDDNEPQIEIRGGGMNLVSIDQCVIGVGGSHGIYADGGTHLNITNSTIELMDGDSHASGNIGIEIVEYQSVFSRGNRFESNGTAVKINPASGEESNDIQITDCSITGGLVAKYGVYCAPAGSARGINISNTNIENFSVSANAYGVYFGSRTSMSIIDDSVKFQAMRQSIRYSTASTTSGNTSIDLSASTPDLSDVEASPSNYYMWIRNGSDFGYYSISAADDTNDIVTVNHTFVDTDTNIPYEIYKYTNYVYLEGTGNKWIRTYPDPNQGVTIDGSGLTGRLDVENRFTANSNLDVQDDSVIFLGSRTTTPNAPASGFTLWYDSVDNTIGAINSSGTSNVVVSF